MATAYLVHHGIKGQKWGVRRFQNPDGSLTSAGHERYDGKKEYRDNAIRRTLMGNNFLSSGIAKGGMRGIRQARVERLKERKKDYEYRSGHTITGKERETKSEKWQKKADKMDQKIKAQKVANLNRDAYDRHTSTGKLMAQNFLMGGWGAEKYRNARAAGLSRGKSYVDMWLGGTITGKIIERKHEKQTYGAATV